MYSFLFSNATLFIVYFRTMRPLQIFRYFMHLSRIIRIYVRWTDSIDIERGSFNANAHNNR